MKDDEAETLGEASVWTIRGRPFLGDEDGPLRGEGAKEVSMLLVVLDDNAEGEPALGRPLSPRKRSPRVAATHPTLSSSSTSLLSDSLLVVRAAGDPAEVPLWGPLPVPEPPAPSSVLAE